MYLGEGGTWEEGRVSLAGPYISYIWALSYGEIY